MSEGGIDVLMKVVGTSNAYAAEGHTTFGATARTDSLLTDFSPGHFCELQEFSFSAGVESSMDGKKKKEKKDKVPEKPQGSAFGGGLTYREKMETIYKGQNAKAREREKDSYVDMQPVEFTRIMDCMSPLLFTALTGCETLASLSVVKRRATGGLTSGDCYLRLDFSDVLFTELEWKDGRHVMLETGTFIYRKVTMQYRPQKSDGSLDVPVQATWTMKAAS